MSGLISLTFLFHKSSDITYNLLNVCNSIQSQCFGTFPVVDLFLYFSTNAFVAGIKSSTGIALGSTYMEAVELHLSMLCTIVIIQDK